MSYDNGEVRSALHVDNLAKFCLRYMYIVTVGRCIVAVRTTIIGTLTRHSEHLDTLIRIPVTVIDGRRRLHIFHVYDICRINMST